MSTQIYVVTTFQKTGVVVMARMADVLGSNITQSTLSSITCKVYDVDQEGLLISSPTVVIASSVHDTPVTTDPRWTTDTTGYNFLFLLTASNFPLAHTYRAEFKFTPVGQDPVPLVVLIPCAQLLSF